MLKNAILVKDIEVQATNVLRQLLQQIPAIQLLAVENEPNGTGQGADIVARISAFGRPHILVCEVKSSGQPRHVRTALLQLRDYVAHQTKNATPMLIAPYLSLDAQTLCREQGVGFLDFEGNASLSMDGVFIDRRVESKPTVERRELKSLFKPKSAQVLRVMIREPARAWRVADLARAADVSLGHVSNVRFSLLDREWAHVSSDGLFLSDPDSLLDAWRNAYDPPAGKALSFYTILHGSALENALRHALHADGESSLAILASFSAAQWLAPYGRTSTQYLYTDGAGLESLKSALKLSAPSKGDNVKVTVLQDYGLFRDTVEPAPGVVCTSPAQTYLDLANAGERGREAAEHLRREKLQWSK